MPADLFYFMSSLPTLRWGEKPPFTREAFMSKCRVELSGRIVVRLERLRLLPIDDVEPGAGIERGWHDFEAYVRNTLGELRQVSLRKEATVFVRRATSVLSPGLRKRLEEVMSMPSPSERELALDQIRWSFLDEVGAGHFFDVEALEVYFLRLLLQDKESSRALEAGRVRFDDIVTKALESAVAARVDS